MARRRDALLPFKPGATQWTRGMKFFAILENTYTLKNLCLPGVGTSSKPTDQFKVHGTAGYPGLHFLDSNGEWISWDRTALGATTGSVTVIGRWKPKAAHYGALLATIPDVGTQTGFSVGFHSALGLVMFVAHNNNFFGAATSDPSGDSGYEYTAGGSFNASAASITLWKGGKEVSTNTDNTQPWNTVASSVLYTGKYHNSNEELDGDIFWVAYFNRALTDAEMTVWTSQDPLDLIYGEDPILKAIIPPLLWANVDLDDNSFTLTGPVSFSFGDTDNADFAGTGTLVSVPGGNLILANEDGEVSVFIFETAVLMPFANLDIDTGLFTFVEVFSFANVDLDTSVFTTTIAGSPGVLASGRYRR